MPHHPRILLTRRWPERVERALAARYDVQFNDADLPMTAHELAAAARAFDIICPTVSDAVTGGMIAQPDRLVRMLCNYGAGVDHIDLAACRGHGVTVSNTPDVLTEATAELAMLLMLMVCRRAGEGERELRAGLWTGWRPTHMLGRKLSGRVLGLVGFGRIAQATARMARGFGMDIIYYSRRPAEAELGATYYAELASLLAAADFVSLHVPGGAATRDLIGAAELRRMKREAYLINTARGSVVDEEALAAALTQGVIAGAGLDVFAGEPHVAPALLAAPNLVALPHLGSATQETREEMGFRALSNLEAFLAGTPLPDRVV
jgi:lactate dehydrogenase-like 2-hydroxyacid dehydrogenase